MDEDESPCVWSQTGAGNCYGRRVTIQPEQASIWRRGRQDTGSVSASAYCRVNVPALWLHQKACECFLEENWFMNPGGMKLTGIGR
jgi:hypothetical protein